VGQQDIALPAGGLTGSVQIFQNTVHTAYPKLSNKSHILKSLDFFVSY